MAKSSENLNFPVLFESLIPNYTYLQNNVCDEHHSSLAYPSNVANNEI